jgi:2-haloacid dehalogenase
MKLTVTMDVFSALTDSRTGGGAFLDELARSRDWTVSGSALYENWDRRNKQLHATTQGWQPFRNLSPIALDATYAEYELDGDAQEDSDALIASMANWPLWPDVTPESLMALPVDRLGLLSNIDDDILAGTRIARLGVIDPSMLLTSEQLRFYKPNRALYVAARERLGDFVHVPTSRRDVEGSRAAGLRYVQLKRPGHDLAADLPASEYSADSIDELAGVLITLTNAPR